MNCDAVNRWDCLANWSDMRSQDLKWVALTMGRHEDCDIGNLSRRPGSQWH
jgi:hypothetical protein